ncbi:MAG TPA: OmpA family protein [Anaeromyxobacteraceae bacterium]|nr:OmpA family protein [Anaeromyxobacteraceae bacterium]
MKKLLPLFVLVSGCAAVSSPPGPPLSHPSFCAYCVPPCKTSYATCYDSAEAAASPAVQPAMAPSFDPGSGAYGMPQKVALSTSTPNAVIHYTTDGSVPTADSPVYTAPVLVASSSTLRAVAIAPGAPPSEVSSATYTIASPAARPRAALGKEKVELTENVHFEFGKAIVHSSSYSLLDEVVTVLKDHPEVRQVMIEGHTDNEGNPAANMKLSKSRAEVVRNYLIQKGIEPDRLKAEGFGSTRPIADNSTSAGREANRRVEFVVAR